MFAYCFFGRAIPCYRLRLFLHFLFTKISIFSGVAFLSSKSAFTNLSVLCLLIAFFCRPCRRAFCCVQLQVRFFVVRMFLRLSAIVFRSPMPMLTDSGCLRSFLVFFCLPRRCFRLPALIVASLYGQSFPVLVGARFSQQMRRNFSRLCSIIAFLGKTTPYCRLRLLSSFLFVKFCCTNLRLFFRQTRRSF